MHVAVIGGGPGGYAAAIGLAHGGQTVTLVEEAAAAGGVCLHRGCIPTKALLETARLCRELGSAEAFGLRLPAAAPDVDWAAVQQRQTRITAALASGLGQLLRAAGVAVRRGRGRLVPTGAVPAVAVTGPDAGTLRPEAIVLAPGAAPARPPIPGLELPGVLDSDALLASLSGPRRLVIIGGGAIGCEMATALAACGTAVTIVEAAGQLLPAADAEIARRLAAAFGRRGIAVHLGAQVRAIRPGPLVEVVPAGGEPLAVAADLVLVATGRRPRTADLGLEDVGIATGPGGAIAVDGSFRCAGAAMVWAIGDAIGPPMLAHSAFRQAAAVTAALTGGAPASAGAIPHPVYSHPEVAWVGSLAEPGGRVARVPAAALGRAHAAGDVDGLCKLVTDASGRIRGVHLLSPHATELIGVGCLAVTAGLSLEALAATTLPHPTLVEGLGEAADLLLGRPLHVPLPTSAR